MGVERDVVGVATTPPCSAEGEWRGTNGSAQTIDNRGGGVNLQHLNV